MSSHEKCCSALRLVFVAFWVIDGALLQRHRRKCRKTIICECQHCDKKSFVSQVEGCHSFCLPISCQEWVKWWISAWNTTEQNFMTWQSCEQFNATPRSMNRTEMISWFMTDLISLFESTQHDISYAMFVLPRNKPISMLGFVRISNQTFDLRPHLCFCSKGCLTMELFNVFIRSCHAWVRNKLFLLGQTQTSHGTNQKLRVRLEKCWQRESQCHLVVI